VSGITEVLAALVGAFVGTVLQVDDALAGAELLFAELTLVLIRLFWSQDWAIPFWVDLSRSAQSEKALRHLRNISPLPQVNSLEDVDFGHTINFAGFLELVNVLHHLELATLGVDFGDAAGHHFVHHPAENGAIAKNFFVWARW